MYFGRQCLRGTQEGPDPEFKRTVIPGWRGSVDWASACKLKGYWLGSLSGHMPGLQAWSPVGGMRGNVSLLSFLPPFPSL